MVVIVGGDMVSWSAHSVKLNILDLQCFQLAI